MVGTPFPQGNPGRPKGAVNKSTKLVKDIFADVFTSLQKHRTANLKKWAVKNPTEFYKLAAKLIPIQVAGDPNNPLHQVLTVHHITTDTPVAENEDEIT